MNKKINQLSERIAVATDLMLVGDPSTGTSYKSTLDTLPLVPYTGATGAVNLGAYDLTVNSLTIGKGASNIATNTANISTLSGRITTTETDISTLSGSLNTVSGSLTSLIGTVATKIGLTALSTAV